MEQSATTLAFERAQPPLPSTRPAADALERVEPGDVDRRVQQAEEEHASRMMVAVGCYLVGGGILASFGKISNTLAAIAVACFAAGVVLQQRAYRKLRAALIDRAVARGASRAQARSEVDAALEQRMR